MPLVGGNQAIAQLWCRWHCSVGHLRSGV